MVLSFPMLVLVLVSPLLFATLIYSELKTEARFYHTYGTNWRLKYEEERGSLPKARTKLALSAFGVVAIPALMAWLYKLMRSKQGARARHHSSRRRIAGGHRITADQFFASIKLVCLFGLVALGGLIGFAAFIISELATESKFRSTYCASWPMEYERVHGSLASAHTRIGLCAVGFLSIILLAAWLRRVLWHSGNNHPNYRSGHGAQ